MPSMSTILKTAAICVVTIMVVRRVPAANTVVFG